MVFYQIKAMMSTAKLHKSSSHYPAKEAQIDKIRPRFREKADPPGDRGGCGRPGVSAEGPDRKTGSGGAIPAEGSAAFQKLMPCYYCLLWYNGPGIGSIVTDGITADSIQ